VKVKHLDTINVCVHDTNIKSWWRVKPFRRYRNVTRNVKLSALGCCVPFSKTVDSREFDSFGLQHNR
jgi:hypothetical protein